MEWMMVIGRKATLSYKGLFSVMNWKQYLLVNLMSPILQMFCFSLVAAYVYGYYDLQRWIIGNAFVITYFNAIFGVGIQLYSEKAIGTLKLLIASPSNRLSIFLPRAILHVFDGMFSTIVGLVAASVLLGFRLPLEVWPTFMLALFIASFSAMSFGLIIACMGMVSRDLNLILNIASMALLALTGANFPIERFPLLLQNISSLMPLTRSIKLARFLSDGFPLTDHLNLVFGELLLGFIFILIGYLTFHRMEKKAIQHGVLELF